MPIVDVGKVANALNLTEMRVQQLVKEGMPREVRGQYDPVKCMLWYVRYLQQALEKKSVPTLDGGFIGERDARVRLLSADADLREMELSKERGRVVSIAVANKACDDLARETTARIMGIPPRLANELVGESSRMMIQAKIESALRDALRLLASGSRGQYGAGPGPHVTAVKS